MVMHRRCFFSLWVVFVLIVGCTGLETRREVTEDNIFHSPTRPQVKIKIDPDFKYIGNEPSHSTAMAEIGGEATTNVSLETYTFRSSRSKRSVIIKIRTLRGRGWYYKPGLFHRDLAYDRGEVVLQGKKYEFSVFPHKNEKNQMLVRALGRITGGNDDIKLEIYYIEAVDKDWGNTRNLTPVQRKKLQAFVAAGQKDIQILE